MGASEYSGLIVVVMFISVFLLIMVVAATETPTFFVTPVGNAPSVPGSQNPLGLLAWNVTNAVQLNNTEPQVEYEITGWTWTRWLDSDSAGHNYFLVESFDTWWFFTHLNLQDFKWYNFTAGQMVSVRLNGHEWVNVTLLDILYEAQTENSTEAFRYTLDNSKGSFQTRLDFNTTAYANFTDALDGEGVFFSIFQDFSDRKTSIDILGVVAGLFLGSLFGANTLGLPVIISSILTIGLDIALAYIVFSIVRSLIPFLPGG